MAEGRQPGPADREGQQPQPQQPPIGAPQQQMHMNWSHFKPKFLVNQRKMLRHIYCELMIG